MSEKKEKELWCFIKNGIYRFSQKKENLGLLFMVVALICFFIFGNNPVPGVLFWKKLSLKFTMSTGFLALISQVLLYLRGIYDIGYNSQESTPKKLCGGIIRILINTAVFTSLFTILLCPTGNANVFNTFFKLLKRIGLAGGILGGIFLFGSKDTASIASLFMFIGFLVKCFDNFNLVSKSAGILGWVYIIFIFLGFLLQENINLKQLNKDLVSLFSFGKKRIENTGDALDRSAEKTVKFVQTVTAIKSTAGVEKNISEDIKLKPNSINKSEEIELS